MRIKAVQLDLARQKENLPFIFSFVDFIEKYNFNTLVLYLEGRIKTASFSLPADDDSYSEQEARQIVEYCRRKDIDVIPIVPSLGHTEMFLLHPELDHLAELYPDKPGRFWGHHANMTCPESEDAYRFFSDYYSEIAALFPSKYFHVGADESWNIGYCDFCRERFRREGRGDGIFRDYLIRMHKILESNGKRMMMWDDMFEIYPDVLRSIPRDIIPCQWHYCDNNDYPRNHFTHHRHHEAFADYKRLGMEFLACPAAWLAGNISGMARYGRKYGALGQILTIWERSNATCFTHYPLVAYGGRLWSEPPMEPDREAELLTETVREVTESTQIQAAEFSRFFFSGCERITNYRISSEHFLGEIHQVELRYCQSLSMFENMLDKMPDNPVNADLRLTLQTQRLLCQFREKFYNYYRYPEFRETIGRNIDKVLCECDELKQARLDQWRECRRGISDSPMVKYFETISETAEELRKAIDGAGCFLHVRYILPDYFGYPVTSIVVEDTCGETHQIVTQKVFKSPMLGAFPYYEYIYPLQLTEAPRAVEIRVRGQGGQGVVYLKVTAENGDFVPAAIESGRGIVNNPLYIMEDDLRWCYLGPHDTETGFVHLEESEIFHTLKIVLKGI